MATRGKVSVYMIFLVMTFGSIGLVSFQSLKERKNLTILLATKNLKIDHLNNQYEVLLEATKKNLMQAKEDIESLSRKVKDLENSNMIYQTSCKHDKEKCENEMNKEVQVLREMLQARDIEIININAKINQLKLNNKKVDTKKVTKLTEKNNLLEKGLESFKITIDGISDKTFENSKLQKVAKDDKANDLGSIVEERNVVNEDEKEDAKIHKDIEVHRANVTNLEESEFATTIKVSGEEDNNVKEFEIDKQSAVVDIGVENNKSYV